MTQITDPAGNKVDVPSRCAICDYDGLGEEGGFHLDSALPCDQEGTRWEIRWYCPSCWDNFSGKYCNEEEHESA